MLTDIRHQSSTSYTHNYLFQLGPQGHQRLIVLEHEGRDTACWLELDWSAGQANNELLSAEDFESSKFFRNPQEKTREKMTETLRVKRLAAGPYASMVTRIFSCVLWENFSVCFFLFFFCENINVASGYSVTSHVHVIFLMHLTYRWLHGTPCPHESNNIQIQPRTFFKNISMHMHRLNFFASPERLKCIIYVACVNVIFGFVLYDDAKLSS